MSTDARGNAGPVPRQMELLAKFSRSDDRQRDTVRLWTDNVLGLVEMFRPGSLDILSGSDNKVSKSNKSRLLVEALELGLLAPLPRKGGV